MQLKSQQHKKSNFINWSKKVLTLFIFLTFLGMAIGQTSNKGKNRTSKNKDSIIKSKSSSAKADQLVALDTIKKSNPLLDKQEVIVDSLFIGNATFKFYKKGAHASYYADKFHNQRTASGIKYDKNKYSAAHKKLPFGTLIKVTNEANGKSVIVEVNDRGPFVRSREIDLSKRAFMEIANNKSSGNMKVTIEVLQK
jgi:rare lipoprotein A